MALTRNGNSRTGTTRAAALIRLLMLPARIESETPILTDSKPLFGDRARFRLYGAA